MRKIINILFYVGSGLGMVMFVTYSVAVGISPPELLLKNIAGMLRSVGIMVMVSLLKFTVDDRRE